ncbi:hemerythrin domain-containing protein [Actinopolymorpha rutila]|uniref:Iron-sulfur cluster repair protein YtfE (RIC family) n=1 Tax=Actinopolymorpha rutila TaxID=446787 RepID=A0A852ZQG8_9ACTN|nr:iron-sulfur cluster repair protein YtfE (RIC family) [Actinopolymorpha rutila]
MRAVREADHGSARRVFAHGAEITSVLDNHLHTEDELLWPPLRARAPLAHDLINRMENQHRQLADLLDRAAVLFSTWAATPQPTTTEELAAVLTELHAVLTSHLDDEEAHVLPLVPDHLTAAEWAELGKRGTTALPKRRRLVFLGHVLEDATPAEQEAFLAAFPRSASLAYRLYGRPAYRKETTALRTSLASGTRPDA